MKNIATKIATNIETGVFYAIVGFLKENGWKLTIEYDDRLFDKGIDFDLYQFTKNNEQILLAWNNWFEGEIKAAPETLNEIATHFGFALNSGAPEYVQQPDIIEAMKSVLKFKK